MQRDLEEDTEQKFYRHLRNTVLPKFASPASDLRAAGVSNSVVLATDSAASKARSLTAAVARGEIDDLERKISNIKFEIGRTWRSNQRTPEQQRAADQARLRIIRGLDDLSREKVEQALGVEA